MAFKMVHVCVGHGCSEVVLLIIFAMMFVWREDYQNCSVLCCVRQLCTLIYAHTWAVLTVGWSLDVVLRFSLPRRRRLCFWFGLFVCLSVCLFVCLSVGLLANLWTDFDEIFWRGRAWLKDQVIQFWWRSGSRFRSGSPKSEIRILRIGRGLCSLSIAFLFVFVSLGFCVLLVGLWPFYILARRFSSV